MTGLISMPVTLFAEHGIQFGYILILASHTIHQSVRILRHIPGIMARSAFSNETGEIESIGIIQESTIGMTSLGISGTGINHIAIIGSTLYQCLVIICLTQSFRHLCKGKIIISIFQSTRHLFFRVECIGYTVFKRNISIFQIRSQGTAPHTVFIFIRVGRSFKSILTHSFISLIHIKITNALTIGITDSGDTMIAYHSGGIAIPARENG